MLKVATHDDELNHTHSDVIYSVKLEGVVAYILLILEHQSTPDEEMPLRMLKYKLSATEKIKHAANLKHLPLVYELLFYHDANNNIYPYSTDFFDMFGEQKELAKDLFFEPVQLIVRHVTHFKDTWLNQAKFRTKDFEVNALLCPEREGGQEHGCKAEII